MRVTVIAPRLLRIHVIGWIPIAHFRPDLTGKVLRIKQRYPVNTPSACHQTFPKSIHGVADGGNYPEPRDNDAA